MTEICEGLWIVESSGQNSHRYACYNFDIRLRFSARERTLPFRIKFISVYISSADELTMMTVFSDSVSIQVEVVEEPLLLPQIFVFLDLKFTPKR